MKKSLPNILTFLRIPLSLLMLVCIERTSILLVLYIICGISDVLDGFLARRLNVGSSFGAKIDSLSDVVFYSVIIIITPLLIPTDRLFIVIFALVAAVRLFNVALVKRKFRQWGGLHTIANKAAGLTLIALWPVCIYLGFIPVWAVVTIGSITFLSALEESALLLSRKSYNPNEKSIFLRKHKN